MKKRRLITGAILLALLLYIMPISALATDALPTDAAGQEGEAVTDTAGENGNSDSDDYFPVLDEQELSDMMEEFLTKRGLKDTNFSMAYCYTGTGETWSYNGDRFWHGASFYKLPLMMYIANKVAAGELQQTDKLEGMDISYIESRAITFSDNNVGEKMIGYVSRDTGRDFRLVLADIGDLKQEDLPPEFLSKLLFSPNYMMNIVKKLYNNPDDYPNVIDCMLKAEPYCYFRNTLEGKYSVAQKYGGGSTEGVRYLHTAGIVYTSVPFLLVVMTRNATNAEYAIAGMAELMANYTNTLTQRIQDHYDEIARQEEEARRAEEEARLAAEQAERERIEAEEAARRAEEEARLAAEEEARRAAELAAQTPSPAPEQTVSSGGGMGVLGILAVGAIAAAGLMCIWGLILLLRKRY